MEIICTKSYLLRMQQTAGQQSQNAPGVVVGRAVEVGAAVVVARGVEVGATVVVTRGVVGSAGQKTAGCHLQ